MSDDYKDFWVVVGTAAPVIALSFVVTVVSFIVRPTPKGRLFRGDRILVEIGAGVATAGFGADLFVLHSAMAVLGGGTQERASLFEGMGAYSTSRYLAAWLIVASMLCLLMTSWLVAVPLKRARSEKERRPKSRRKG